MSPSPARDGGPAGGAAPDGGVGRAGGDPSRPARAGARERKAMLLRLDPAVHDALARWAAEDLRSTNAHVEWLLRHAVERAGRLPPERG